MRVVPTDVAKARSGNMSCHGRLFCFGSGEPRPSIGWFGQDSLPPSAEWHSFGDEIVLVVIEVVISRFFKLFKSTWFAGRVAELRYPDSGGGWKLRGLGAKIYLL